MTQANPQGRWVAIVTGAISILIAVAYLAFITVLDARGPLQPPPPEAFRDAAGGVAAVAPASPDAATAPPLG
ncbi:hypothetical protein [Synechococcus sp. LTW-R]|uniref:hypothetical protein n=1 Tax=Synechococcus sp. LTW-R TaxID=2751170 RepID=UPI00162A1784|nr:hypothetical protein [Synechococcus sp. LTW-R]QNG30152.1 hypothetical protein H0O22_03140 [Synechococcus sp. LTW-R]